VIVLIEKEGEFDSWSKAQKDSNAIALVSNSVVSAAGAPDTIESSQACEERAALDHAREIVIVSAALPQSVSVAAVTLVRELGQDAPAAVVGRRDGESGVVDAALTMPMSEPFVQNPNSDFVLSPFVSVPAVARITLQDFEEVLMKDLKLVDCTEDERYFYYCQDCSGNMINRKSLSRHFSGKGTIGRGLVSHKVCGAICGGCEDVAYYGSPLRQCIACVASDVDQVKAACRFYCNECLNFIHNKAGYHKMLLSLDEFPTDFVECKPVVNFTNAATATATATANSTRSSPTVVVGSSLSPLKLGTVTPPPFSPLPFTGIDVATVQAEATPNAPVVQLSANQDDAVRFHTSGAKADPENTSTSNIIVTSASTLAVPDSKSVKECLNCLTIRNILVDIINPLLVRVCEQRWSELVVLKNSQCPACKTDHYIPANPLTCNCIFSLINIFLAKEHMDNYRSSMYLSLQNIEKEAPVTTDLYIQRLDVAAVLDLIRLFESLIEEVALSGRRNYFLITNELSQQLRECRNQVYHTNAIHEERYTYLLDFTKDATDALCATLRKNKIYLPDTLDDKIKLEQAFIAAKTEVVPRKLIAFLTSKIYAESKRQTLDTLVGLIGGELMGAIGNNSLRQSLQLCQSECRKALFIPALDSNAEVNDFLRHLHLMMEVGKFQFVYNFNEDTTRCEFTKRFEAENGDHLTGACIYSNSSNKLSFALQHVKEWFKEKWVVALAYFGPVDRKQGKVNAIQLLDNVRSDLHELCCLRVGHDDALGSVENSNGDSMFGVDCIVDMDLVSAYLNATQLKNKGEVWLLPAGASRGGITSVSTARCLEFARSIEVLHLECGKMPSKESMKKYQQSDKLPVLPAQVLDQYRESVLRAETEQYLSGTPPSWFLAAQNKLLSREKLKVLRISDG
jgi:hypothetical protein